ncbi:MAG TPA: NADP-dependent malic enzyme [Thermoplasmata archaeon]|nr:NADP-dependent malic enzyme [Thermoplasmata archaeon]
MAVVRLSMVQAGSSPVPPDKPARKRRTAAADSAEAEEAQTRALGERAVELAGYFQGKVETVPKVPVRSLDDFALWYTPGIAAVAKAIEADPARAFDLTGRWNTIAIVTDGSRVLGLGNIGPEAALPVMEGKALLFKFLGGVDAVPIPIRVNSPDEFVATVEHLAPAFGAVNLEDIASPKCFDILERLTTKLPIPVWHDDQLGTAAATVAGLLNALELTHRSVGRTRTVLLGAGAANLVTARLLIALGQDPKRLTLVDHKGVLHAEREDMDALMVQNRWKYRLALETDGGGRAGSLADALAGADVLVAASTPDPNTVSAEMVRSMAHAPVVFALANPVPEIWPATAREAGAAIVATGRSDFPNQVNNSLVFPPVFRGILDARARAITDEIVLAAARELARQAHSKGLAPDHLLPTMEEMDVFPHIAAAVAEAAVREGLARRELTREEFYSGAQERMRRPPELVRILAQSGLTQPMPGEGRGRGSKKA